MKTYYEPTRRSEKLMTWLCAIAGVLAVIAFFQWTADRDQKLMTWAESYEKCVATKYRTTPSAWYIEHGSYPACDASSYNAEMR